MSIKSYSKFLFIFCFLTFSLVSFGCSFLPLQLNQTFSKSDKGFEPFENEPNIANGSTLIESFSSKPTLSEKINSEGVYQLAPIYCDATWRFNYKKVDCPSSINSEPPNLFSFQEHIEGYFFDFNPAILMSPSSNNAIITAEFPEIFVDDKNSYVFKSWVGIKNKTNQLFYDVEIREDGKDIPVHSFNPISASEATQSIKIPLNSYQNHTIQIVFIAKSEQEKNSETLIWGNPHIEGFREDSNISNEYTGNGVPGGSKMCLLTVCSPKIAILYHPKVQTEAEKYALALRKNGATVTEFKKFDLNDFYDSILFAYTTVVISEKTPLSVVASDHISSQDYDNFFDALGFSQDGYLPVQTQSNIFIDGEKIDLVPPGSDLLIFFDEYSSETILNNTLVSLNNKN